MDVITPAEEKEECILIYVDGISLFSIVNTYNDMTVGTMVDFVTGCFCDLGSIPSILMSDMKNLIEFNEDINTKLKVNIICQKMEDEANEIMNTIKDNIIIQIDKIPNMVSNVKVIQYNLNNTINKFLKITPYEALFGRSNRSKFIGLPETAEYQEKNDDQGGTLVTSCNCKSCSNKRCACIKGGTLCSEKCHGGKSCTNSQP